MSNTELLQSISDLLDQKLEEKLEKKLEEKLTPINHRLDNIESRVGGLEHTINNEVLPKIQKLESTMDNEVLPKIQKLESTMDNEVLPKLSKLQVAVDHDIKPALNEIVECYSSTYERYQKGITQLDEMQTDIEAIKIAVTDHSEELQKYTGPYLVN